MLAQIRIFLVCGWAAYAAEPLPRELAARLDLARMLPPTLAASAIVQYAGSAILDREQKTELASEAYLLATLIGEAPMQFYAVRQRDSATEWLIRKPAHVKNSQSAALAAWSMYNENYDREKQKPLEYPIRKAGAAETCSVALVDDPLDYFEVARKAGKGIFGRVTQSVKNPIEHGRILAVFAELAPAERPMFTIQLWLIRVAPDRHFAYAMEYTPYHNSLLRIIAEANEIAARNLLYLYASFLKRHWTQKRCLGNESIEYSGIIQEFNKTAADLEEKFRGAAMPRLTEDAGKALSVDAESYAESAEDTRDLTLLRSRILGSGQDELSVTSMLRAVEEFRPPERLPVATRILQKNFAFRGLLNRHSGSVHERAIMTSWLRYFASSRAAREAPQVWMAATRDVMEWVGKDRARMAIAENAGDSALAALLRLNVLDAK